MERAGNTGFGRKDTGGGIKMKKLFMTLFSLSLFFGTVQAAEDIMLDEKMVAGDTVSYDFSYTAQESNPSDVSLNVIPSDEILNDVTSVSIFEGDKLVYSSKELKADEIELQDYSPNEARNYRIELEIDKDADNEYTQMKNELKLEFVSVEHETPQTGVQTYWKYLLSGLLLSGLFAMICYKKRESRKQP